jgi:hypothetical protein
VSIFNHDLLVNDEDPEWAKTAYPDVAEFLDWPELRDVFKPIDQQAGARKRSSRLAGIAAVIFGVIALWLAASEPLLKTYPVGGCDEIILARSLEYACFKTA